MPTTSADREAIGDIPNPLGLAGIEYVEYTTHQPQALGRVLELAGFSPVARHRSREVTLYRPGPLNLVVNAEPGVVQRTAARGGSPFISAVALRVNDARAACERALAEGAWDVPTHAQAMELNIPGIHGPGGAHLYFVDRWREFSIFDIDFRPIPGVDPKPASAAALRWFGIVQYIGRGRTDDWVSFYKRLLGFAPLPPGQRFGILPKGTLLASPCEPGQRFYLQLIEPDPQIASYDEEELFQRIGLGTANVPGAVAALKKRGLEFVESSGVHVTDRGAVTRHFLQSVVFELVHDER
jgi:4-hydroxyphenylpyruvate dioxygenase